MPKHSAYSTCEFIELLFVGRTTFYFSKDFHTYYSLIAFVQFFIVDARGLNHRLIPLGNLKPDKGSVESAHIL